MALLPLTALVQNLAARFPQLVETVYSRGAYPVIARIVTIATGWIPTSLAELLVAAILIWIAWSLVRTIAQLVRKQRSVLDAVLHGSVLRW